MRLLVLALSVVACEEIPSTPGPDTVCLAPSSGDNIHLCDPSVCVSRTHVVKLASASDPAFTRVGTCPTAAELAQNGVPLESYPIGYRVEDPASAVSLEFGFDGGLCAEPPSVGALQRHLRGGDYSGDQFDYGVDFDLPFPAYTP